MPKRTIAIGDVHGCSLALRAVIEALQPQADDTLVTLGDYVDKGIDSRGVLDVLLEVETRCRLIPLLGNHDAMMLGAIEGRLDVEGWKAMGGTATLQSYGESECVEDIPARHADFLRRCHMWYETPANIFVHAAYDPVLPLDQQDAATLFWQGIRHAIPGPHVSGKTAIVGHTSQKNGEILDADHLVCIDTNCWNGGWLTALDVGSQMTWQADEAGRMRSPSDTGMPLRDEAV